MIKATSSGRFGLVFRRATFVVLLAAAVHAPAAASDRHPDTTIRIGLEDVDLASRKGKSIRDYRVGANAAAACDGGERQSASQFNACVQRAVRAGQRRCTQRTESCLVAIDRYAKLPATPRPNFGPRSPY